MNIDQLPKDTRAMLDELIERIVDALNVERSSPHLTAVSRGSKPDGPDSMAYNGCGVYAPHPPEFDAIDDDDIKQLHRDILDSADGVLHTIILRAQRASADTPWTATLQIVSRADYAALVEKRKPIDDQVATLLAEHAGKDVLEYINYGRSNDGEPPKLVKRPKGAKPRFLADPRLDELLAKAEKLYRTVDLELVTLVWSRHGKELEIRDWFE